MWVDRIIAHENFSICRTVLFVISSEPLSLNFLAFILVIQSLLLWEGKDLSVCHYFFLHLKKLLKLIKTKWRTRKAQFYIRFTFFSSVEDENRKNSEISWLLELMHAKREGDVKDIAARIASLMEKENIDNNKRLPIELTSDSSVKVLSVCFVSLITNQDILYSFYTHLI